MANRQHLPLVPIRFVPVDTPPAKVPVDLRVSWTAHLAPEFDARRLDATQNCVKLLFRDAEAEVVDGKLLICIDEVKGQAIVYVDRRKRPEAHLSPFDAKQFSEQSRGSDLVARRDDGVIEMHCHFGRCDSKPPEFGYSSKRNPEIQAIAACAKRDAAYRQRKRADRC